MRKREREREIEIERERAQDGSARESARRECERESAQVGKTGVRERERER